MKHIFLNLKRFDISPEKGGVNRLAPMKDWGRAIVSGTQDALTAYDPAEVEFVMYMPEAHLLGAAAAKTENSPVQLGCQGVYRADTAVGGNFGAFTTNRPANAAAQSRILFMVNRLAVKGYLLLRKSQRFGLVVETVPLKKKFPSRSSL